MADVNKKSIVYFVPEFPRLTETFIEREISKLIDLGHVDITVLSLAKASGVASENVVPHVAYRRITWAICFKAGFLFLLKPFLLLDLYKTILKDSKNSLIQKTYLFLKSVAYSQIFKEYKPDHIHVHFLSDPSTVAMIVSKILNVPFSISAHAKDIFIQGTLIYEKVHFAKFLAICNKYAHTRVLQDSDPIDEDKVRLLYHGVDTNKVFNDLPKIERTEKPLIICVARLTEKKGLKYLIEASKVLKDRGIAHEIKIIGNDEGLYAQLVKQITDLGVQENVEILGGGKGIPNKQVFAYLKAADIFVFPSIEAKDGDVDGVPTGVIEAALSQLPIIASNVGSTSDLITTDTGILLPPADVKWLADSIEKLILNPVLRSELGQKAYEKAKLMFDIEKNVGELEGMLMDSNR